MRLMPFCLYAKIENKNDKNLARNTQNLYGIKLESIPQRHKLSLEQLKIHHIFFVERILPHKDARPPKFVSLMQFQLRVLPLFFLELDKSIMKFTWKNK